MTHILPVFVRGCKADIEVHSEHYSHAHPALNVKAYHFPHTTQVEDTFKCSEAVAEKALQFAWDSAQERFWEDVDDLAHEKLDKAFGSSFKVYSEGRSGGWLTVHELPDVDTWDAIKVSAWDRFGRAVKAFVDDLCLWENVKGDIVANRWAEEGEQAYNFIELADGSSVCQVDLRADVNAYSKGKYGIEALP
jgi:hypothetical protein